MTNKCIQTTRHFHCKDCKKNFSRTSGDVINPIDSLKKCPYCGSFNIDLAEANAIKEGFDYISSKIGKIVK